MIKLGTSVLLSLFIFATGCGDGSKNANIGGKKKKSEAVKGSTEGNVDRDRLFATWTSKELEREVSKMGTSKSYLRIEDGRVSLFNLCNFESTIGERLVANASSAAIITGDRIKVLEIVHSSHSPSHFGTVCTADVSTDTFLYRFDGENLVISNGQKDLTLERVAGESVAELTKN